MKKKLSADHPISIVIFDRNRKILSANRVFCDTFKFRREQILNKELTSLLVPKAKSPKSLEKMILNSTNGQRLTVQKHVKFQTSSKKEKRFDVKIIKLNSNYREEDRFILFLDDITDKMQLAEKLKHSATVSSLSKLTTAVIHKINNPLGVISGNAQYLLMQLENLGYKNLTSEDFSESINSLQIIYAESMKLGKLMDMLLQFSCRINSKKAASLDVNQEIKKLLENIEMQFTLYRI